MPDERGEATEAEAREFEAHTGLKVFTIRNNSSLPPVWCYRIDNDDRKPLMLRVVPAPVEGAAE